jgi:uncharacterized protein (TIGR04255 family)
VSFWRSFGTAIAMANYCYLEHAPIIEAVIDFRAKLPGNFDTSQLRAAALKIRDEYPTTEERNSFQAMVQLDPRKPTVSTQPPKFFGLFLKAPDQKQIAQFRVDGFAFSRLQPYTRWQEVVKEASRLWQVYTADCSPIAVTRIAVRYINRMEIPYGQFELSDYLTAPPAVPPDLAFPSVMTGYSHRILITNQERGLNATIIQASEPVNELDKSILILDIDAYKSGEFNIDGSLFSILEELRNMKNDIFFKSITEKTVELFK